MNTIVPWPANCMRHTFATYHIAMWQDANKTAYALGHTSGVDVLYQHYRGLATKAEAERFWGLRP